MISKTNVVVYSTTDYSIFRNNPFNRKIDKINIFRLKQSFQKKEGMIDSPAIVTPDKTIIDGQHRLEVCKELSLPFYFIITEKLELKDVQLFNTAGAKWKNEDFLDYFITEGNKNYIEFKKYKEKYCIPSISKAIKIFNDNNFSKATGSEMYDFKKGKYVFSVNETLLSFYIETVNNLSDMLKRKHFEEYIINAIAKIIKSNKIDVKKLLQKVEKFGIKSGYRDTASLLDQLNEVWNYNQKEKISIF